MSILRDAAETSYNRRLAEYNALVEQERKDLAGALRDKKVMSDHHWQARHDAERKKDAAAKLLAIVIEEEGKEGL